MTETAQTYETQVAQKLRHLRDKKRLSQYAVADGAQVARRAYCAWENAENVPSGRSLKKLADFYGIGMDKLLK